MNEGFYIAGVAGQISNAAIVCVFMRSNYPLINNPRTTLKLSTWIKLHSSINYAKSKFSDEKKKQHFKFPPQIFKDLVGSSRRIFYRSPSCTRERFCSPQ